MKLVVFDIDETLAQDRQISPVMQKALRQLRNRGCYVCFISDRPRSWVQKNFYMYYNGYAACNGRLVFTCCEKVVSAPVTDEQIEKVRSAVQKTKTAAAYYGIDRGILEGPDHLCEKLIAAWDKDRLNKTNPLPKAYFGIDIAFESEEQLEAFRNEMDDVIIHVHTDGCTADLTLPGCDKAAALKAMADKLGVSKEDTYVIADGINDLSMIKEAGHSAAMATAPDEVKKAADFTTADIRHEGAAEALKRFGLL